MRREPLSRAITAIPHDVIAGFAGRPVLLDRGINRSVKAPYIVALRDDHLIGGLGNEIYARGIENRSRKSASASFTSKASSSIQETRKSLG